MVKYLNEWLQSPRIQKVKQAFWTGCQESSVSVRGSWRRGAGVDRALRGRVSSGRQSRESV